MEEKGFSHPVVGEQSRLDARREARERRQAGGRGHGGRAPGRGRGRGNWHQQANHVEPSAHAKEEPEEEEDECFNVSHELPLWTNLEYDYARWLGI
jgi:hypothetical protein